MIAKEQLASWDEAAANVPFPVHEPAYMPAGYRQKSLVFAYPDGPPEYKMRSATLYAEYVHEDGRDLRVNQGYGVGAAAEHLVAPEQYRGTVAIGTTTVYWINGNRLWEYRGNVGYPLEVWDESSVGSFTA